MSLLEIMHYPEPVLLTVGRPVDEFGHDLEKLVADMFETMEKAQGVGLAAPQVGISRRLFVMDVPMKDAENERHVLINPEILHIEGEQVGDEGCLSFPGLYQTVKREMRVIARAQNVKGEEFELDVSDLAARCILHETDHCDGIVFLDRMTPLNANWQSERLRLYKKQGSGTNLDIQDTKLTAEIGSSGELNKYLGEGWTLLLTYVKHSRDSHSPRFVVGWQAAGAPVFPELLDEWEQREIDRQRNR